MLSTVIVAIVGVAALISQGVAGKEKLTVQAIDGGGIFVGDQELAPIPQQDSKIHPGILQDQKEHEASLRAIDAAAEQIRKGNSYDDANQLEEAAKAYKAAYSIGGGSRAVSGLKLAMIYEKLGRYDEGIALLDEMIAKPYLSEKGIQNANGIRARLLVAKKQSNQ